MLRNIAACFFIMIMLLGGEEVFAQPSEGSAPFNESVWRIEKLHNQTKTIQTYQGEKNYVAISFNPYTHKVTGRGLCNKFMAKFENKNNVVTIKDVITTHETCLSDDVNAQDKLFFSYLKSIKSYSIHGKILRLKDAQNQSLIIARWAK
ncbi:MULTISPECIES: META domain-containing protein [Commensalibacter]|uniref:DUF306 domain-containing protein n=2 Tax=Commensalibacter TaxID=1079922 RepID=W7DSG0_9PROT|nr:MULTISPECIES: META domain-containing protein [Commensalibacter]EUK17850.1 hypothetical protein COMX_07645 [Commensalibacter papalotli (ex Servin-Garciduenas et al. 2014)]CAI3942995.1 Heat shock protein HslJ (HslJ) (PDB:2KTS) [Commensalibacter papalotli (ex Botero et al. 2024)]CAI3947937.1 Heat shock protein HslJ (HslJ) (PDB:2KTS) [Commensalibacter papalotli (ex Botero et al. 2024)]